MDVTVDVQAGELAMIVGRNGCGKSTLLSVLRGAFLAESGYVHVDEPVSYVRSDPNLGMLYPTIGCDVSDRVPSEVWEGSDEPRHVIERRVASVALTAVGLTPPDKYWLMAPRNLSGGIKQRAVLAGAIVTRPKVLLLDEVTASVDPLNRAEILESVTKIVKQDNVAALW